MLEPLPTVQELIAMSGLTQVEICRRTGISVKLMSEYKRGIYEPRFYNYQLIYNTVRQELQKN